MQKTILSIAFILFGATIGWAQEIDYEKVATRITANWTKQLDLSEEQQKAVYDIVFKHVNTKAKVSADKEIPADELPDRLHVLDTALDNNIAEQLTMEQKEIYAKFIAERRNRKAERSNRPE